MTYICAGYLAEYDINVNAVCPGIVKTDMLAGILSGRSGDVSVNMDELESNMTSEVPLGRANEADDIANLVVFLSGPGSRKLPVSHITLMAA
ncbi:MAG: hypothetical protein CM1200mP3_17890 [Chloroflexota bacterium]|nr:MAG: hypothetical protein CM1200mP3_17890 [Chloroflexota bacterium]